MSILTLILGFAIVTILVMNVYYAPALRALPAFLLLANEISDAALLDELQVLYHAHPVLALVPLVQSLEALAGVVLANKTELLAFSSGDDITVSDDALPAIPGNIVRLIVAARTLLLFSEVAAADRAVHPARCDHLWLDAGHWTGMGPAPEKTSGKGPGEDIF